MLLVGHLCFRLQAPHKENATISIMNCHDSIVDAASIVSYCPYQINLKLTHWYDNHTVTINPDAWLGKCNLLSQSYQ